MILVLNNSIMIKFTKEIEEPKKVKKLRLTNYLIMLFPQKRTIAHMSLKKDFGEPGKPLQKPLTVLSSVDSLIQRTMSAM